MIHVLPEKIMLYQHIRLEFRPLFDERLS